MKKCIYCEHIKGSEPVVGCFIGTPRFRRSKYHKYDIKKEDE